MIFETTILNFYRRFLLFCGLGNRLVFKQKNHTHSSVKLLSKKFLMLFLTIALVFNFFSPISARAGFFSFFEKIFGGSKEKFEALGDASTIQLLQAPINENPIAGQGGAILNIVGKSALLPVTGPLGSIADVEEIKPQSDQISIYVVRPGDSLYQVAEMFNVSVNTIMWSNDIKKGDKYMKVYKQMKMYNDDDLNPVLRNQK